MSRPRSRSWVHTVLIAAAGAVTMLSVSAVLLSGYQTVDARKKADAQRRKALSARADYASRQQGTASTVESPRDVYPDTSVDSESLDVQFNSSELAVHVDGLPETSTKVPLAPTAPRRPGSRVTAQGNAFGALALVMLALLGAALAMGLFHADPSTKNWIGAMTIVSLIGLALAWRGILPPHYVGRSAIVALFVLMAYGFIDARRRGRYTWPVRIGVAAAFVAVCCVLSWYGRAV